MKEVCFIIYKSKYIEYADTIEYIKELIIPLDVNVDCLVIEGHEKQENAYEEGRLATKAKYKVYLNANDYILNKNFICEVMNIFAQNERIGIVGLMGGIEKEGKYIKYGQSQEDSIVFGVRQEKERIIENTIKEVSILEESVIVTTMDIPWIDDTDNRLMNIAEQCKEIIKQGYKVVVARQETPWCMREVF